MSATTLVFKGFDKRSLMRQIEAQQTAQLKQLRPLVDSVIMTTVGTQYFSLAELRRRKHPYRIGGVPPMPPGVINAQSRRFLKAMQVIGPTKIGEKLVIQVYNTDEERAWQLSGEGESRQVPRLYKVLMRARLRRQAARQLAAISQNIKFKVVS